MVSSFLSASRYPGVGARRLQDLKERCKGRQAKISQWREMKRDRGRKGNQRRRQEDNDGQTPDDGH